MAKKATPEEHMERFLKAGGSLTEKQWNNMSKRTRQMYLENKEVKKPNAAKAAGTRKAGNSALKKGDYE